MHSCGSRIVQALQQCWFALCRGRVLHTFNKPWLFSSYFLFLRVTQVLLSTWLRLNNLLSHPWYHGVCKGCDVGRKSRNGTVWEASNVQFPKSGIEVEAPGESLLLGSWVSIGWGYLQVACLHFLCLCSWNSPGVAQQLTCILYKVPWSIYRKTAKDYWI